MSEWNRPRIGPNTIGNLRPYQIEAKEAIFSEWNAGRRGTSVVHSTGLGKSVLAAHTSREIAETGANVLCLSHTRELVKQMANWLHRAGLPTGIEMGSLEARAHFDPMGVSATVQTMQGDRLLSWPKGYFAGVIVDEMHHHTAGSGYDRIIDHLDPIFVLGITATLKRNDGKKPSPVYESIAHTYSLLDAVKAPHPGPYLCRPKCSLVHTDIDLGSLSRKAGDYTDEHLEKRILPNVRRVAKAVLDANEGRTTIVFVPSIKCAEGVASALSSLGVRADWVSGEREGRSSILERMNKGDLDVLVNVAVLSEGWDCPRASCVVIARPTRSWGLLVQMLGRVTRRHDESGKQDCLMVDLGFITPEHDLLAMPVDLFEDHRNPPGVMETARDMIRSRAASGERGIDLADAIEEATKEVKKKAEWRVEMTGTEVGATRIAKYDMVTMASEMLDMTLPAQPRTARSIPATEGQARCLASMGLGEIQGLSKTLASTMIDRAVRRKEKGLCTAKQFTHLRKAGVPIKEARDMTLHEATAYLNTLWGK